jgi:hypothetical protein
MQLIFRADLELLTLMLIDRANRRRYFRALAVENELDSMMTIGNAVTDRGSSAPNTARYTAICCKMPYCSVKRPQNSHPKPDRGVAVRNGEVELASRGRGSSIWTTSGRFSVKPKNDTHFATKRRPTKRPPNPTDLGRISDETA